MSNQRKVETFEVKGFEAKIITEPYRVSGWLDGVEVIGFTPIMGKWTTGTSICLPSDTKKAFAIIKVFNKTRKALIKFNKEHNLQLEA